MIKKIIKCNDITFENLTDFVEYVKQPIDHSYHIAETAINEIKDLVTKYEILKAKYADTEENETVANVLAGLDKIEEDTAVCQDALKMNTLLQSKEIKTDLIEDIEDEAHDLLEREAPDKLN